MSEIVVYEINDCYKQIFHADHLLAFILIALCQFCKTPSIISSCYVIDNKKEAHHGAMLTP